MLFLAPSPPSLARSVRLSPSKSDSASDSPKLIPGRTGAGGLDGLQLIALAPYDARKKRIKPNLTVEQTVRIFTHYIKCSTHLQ
jgi:hypothetical protein